jgi:hypothetical protein
MLTWSNSARDIDRIAAPASAGWLAGTVIGAAHFGQVTW